MVYIGIRKKIRKHKWFYKIGKTAEMLGVHTDTLRRWDNEGLWKAQRTPKGTRIYGSTEIKKLLKERNI